MCCFCASINFHIIFVVRLISGKNILSKSKFWIKNFFYCVLSGCLIHCSSIFLSGATETASVLCNIR